MVPVYLDIKRCKGLISLDIRFLIRMQLLLQLYYKQQPKLPIYKLPHYKVLLILIHKTLESDF